MKLMLAGDNENFRDDLKYFIENKLDHNVVAEATDVEELLTLPTLSEAEIILLDITVEKKKYIDTVKKMRFV